MRAGPNERKQSRERLSCHLRWSCRALCQLSFQRVHKGAPSEIPSRVCRASLRVDDRSPFLHTPNEVPVSSRRMIYICRLIREVRFGCCTYFWIIGFSSWPFSAIKSVLRVRERHSSMRQIVVTIETQSLLGPNAVRMLCGPNHAGRKHVKPIKHYLVNLSVYIYICGRITSVPVVAALATKHLAKERKCTDLRKVVSLGQRPMQADAQT